MDKLLWFHGITMQTRINEIGWTYVVLAFLLIGIGMLIEEIRKDL